jgi:hypothetical protein
MGEDLMYVPMPKPLNIRDLRLMLATAGATAALLAFLAPGEPFAFRIAASAAGGLLATLVHGPISRVPVGPRLALNLVGLIPLAGLAFVLVLSDWGGDSVAFKAAAAFVFGFGVFVTLVIGDRLRTIVRGNL